MFAFDEASTESYVAVTLATLKARGELTYDTSKLIAAISETCKKAYEGENSEAFIAEATAGVLGRLDRTFARAVVQRISKIAEKTKSLRWFKDSDEDKAVLDYMKVQYSETLNGLVMAKGILSNSAAGNDSMVALFLSPEMNEEAPISLKLNLTKMKTYQGKQKELPIEAVVQAKGLSSLLYLSMEKVFGSHHVIIVDDNTRGTEAEAVVAREIRHYLNYRSDRASMTVSALEAEHKAAGESIKQSRDHYLDVMGKSESFVKYLAELEKAIGRKPKSDAVLKNYSENTFEPFVKLYPEIASKHQMDGHKESVRFLKSALGNDSAKVKPVFMSKLMGIETTKNRVEIRGEVKEVTPPLPNFIDEWFDALFKGTPDPVVVSE